MFKLCEMSWLEPRVLHDMDTDGLLDVPYLHPLLKVPSRVKDEDTTWLTFYGVGHRHQPAEHTKQYLAERCVRRALRSLEVNLGWQPQDDGDWQTIEDWQDDEVALEAADYGQ